MDEKNILPIHIALIPDGNRRWAKNKGFNPWIGHLWGARVVSKILNESLNMGVKCVSFWGGSYDNLTKRADKEINYLFNIYARYVLKPIKRKDLHKNKIRVRVLGRYKEILPEKIIKDIENLEKETENYDSRFLNLLIAYNGTDEMLHAFRNIASQKLNPDEITEDTIKKNLWTRSTPAVDLIIRTGEENDPHNSAGFMMFDTVYSQYYFTKTLWPDFTPQEFRIAVEKFMNTERRRGG